MVEPCRLVIEGQIGMAGETGGAARGANGREQDPARGLTRICFAVLGGLASGIHPTVSRCPAPGSAELHTQAGRDGLGVGKQRVDGVRSCSAVSGMARSPPSPSRRRAGRAAHCKNRQTSRPMLIARAICTYSLRPVRSLPAKRNLPLILSGQNRAIWIFLVVRLAGAGRYASRLRCAAFRVLKRRDA